MESYWAHSRCDDRGGAASAHSPGPAGAGPRSAAIASANVPGEGEEGGERPAQKGAVAQTAKVSRPAAG